MAYTTRGLTEQAPRHPRVGRRSTAIQIVHQPLPLARFREIVCVRANPTAYRVDPEDGLIRLVPPDVARIQRIPGTTFLGVLAEGLRTNSVQRSAALENAYWTFGGATVGADAANGPGGVLTMEKLTVAAATQTGASRGRKTLGAAGVASIWVKAASGATRAQIDSGNAPPTQSAVLSSTPERIQRYNGSAGSAEATVIVGPSGGPYTIGHEAYVWGMQFEAGARFASSYIDTKGAAVTRQPDDLRLGLPIPKAIIDDGLTLVFVPEWDTANDAQSGDLFTLLELDNLTLRFRHTGTGVILEVIELGDTSFPRIATGNLSFSRDQALEVTLRPRAGTLQVRKATAGDGTFSGTGFLPRCETRVAQIGSSMFIDAHAFGVISEPFPVGTVLLP